MRLIVHTQPIVSSVEKFDIPLPAHVHTVSSVLIRCINESEAISNTRTLAGHSTILLSGGHEKIIADAEVLFNDPNQHINRDMLKTGTVLTYNTFARIVYKSKRAITGNDKLKVYLLINE